MTTNIKDIRNSIRECIAKDEIEKAFSLLKENIPKDSENYEELLKLKGGYEYYKRREMQGLHSSLEASIELNKVRSSLTGIIDLHFGKADEETERDGKFYFGYLDYMERFQSGFVKLNDFVYSFNEAMQEYREQTSRDKLSLDNLIKSSGKKKSSRFGNSYAQKIAQNANRFASSMEEQIPSFTSFSDEILESLYKAYVLISDVPFKGKGKLAVLEKMNSDFDSLLQIYGKFREIAKQGLNQNNRLKGVSSQINFAQKRIDKIYITIDQKSAANIDSAIKYRTEMRVILAKERVRQGQFFQKLLQGFILPLRRLLGRKP